MIWLLRRAARRARRRPTTLGGAVAAFAAMATLGTAAICLGRSAEETARWLADEAHVLAYLAPDFPAERAEALTAALARSPDVRTIRDVDGQSALAHLRREVASLGQPLANLGTIEDGLLPRSLEITLRAGPRLADRAAEVGAKLRRLDGIVAVDVMAEGLGRIAAWSSLARRLSIALAATAALAGLVMAGALALRERERRRQEIAALALVGATPAAMRVPSALLASFAAAIGAFVGIWVGPKAAGALVGIWAIDHPPAGLMGSEPLLAIAVVTAFGLGVGCLSLPRPRTGVR